MDIFRLMARVMLTVALFTTMPEEMMAKCRVVVAQRTRVVVRPGRDRLAREDNETIRRNEECRQRSGAGGGLQRADAERGDFSVACICKWQEGALRADGGRGGDQNGEVAFVLSQVEG